MSVGEETIDSQHKKLLAYMGRLEKIISSLDVNMGQLRETIHFLYTYIKEHFSYEEEYMLNNGFPSLEEHRKMHGEFIKFYEDLQKKLREKFSNPDFSSFEIKELLEDAEKYLREWLVHHIKGADQVYAGYIRKTKKTK